METARDLLIACKGVLHVETDYKLAKAMDMHNGLMSDYMAGKRIPDVYACMRIAEILDRDPLEIIALVEAERAKNDKRRAFWHLFLQRAGKRAAAVTLALAFGFSLVSGFAAGSPNRLFLRPKNYA